MVWHLNEPQTNTHCSKNMSPKVFHGIFSVMSERHQLYQETRFFGITFNYWRHLLLFNWKSCFNLRPLAHSERQTVVLIFSGLYLIQRLYLIQFLFLVAQRCSPGNLSRTCGFVHNTNFSGWSLGFNWLIQKRVNNVTFSITSVGSFCAVEALERNAKSLCLRNLSAQPWLESKSDWLDLLAVKLCPSCEIIYWITQGSGFRCTIVQAAIFISVFALRISVALLAIGIF